MTTENPKSVALVIRDRATGEEVERIDVRSETPSGIAQIKAGIRSQMNHTDFQLHEETR